MCVFAIGKEPAVALTELKTIYNLLPDWDLNERHISLSLNLSPCSLSEDWVEIHYPRHMYAPKNPLTIQKIKNKRLWLYVQVFMWFEAEIVRSGVLEVATQRSQKCWVAVLLTNFTSCCCILLVDRDVLALFALRKAGEVMLCLAVSYCQSWS